MVQNWFGMERDAVWRVLDGALSEFGFRKLRGLLPVALDASGDSGLSGSQESST
jgi:hypothetical protein